MVLLYLVGVSVVAVVDDVAIYVAEVVVLADMRSASILKDGCDGVHN